jgi:predicted NACHT family NTPase
MLLRAGRALLLFDGLDEVQEAERSRLITELEKLRRRYHGCCMLLTCRTAATGYQFERARYVDVADFTPDQMDAFARRWFGIALRMNSQAATQNPLKRVPINAARGDTVRF